MILKHNREEKDKLIFIQIASYRDPELRATLADMLANAKYPQNLRICIAWQHSSDDEWDQLDEYIEDNRFTIIDIDYKESNGVCWARNIIQQYYKGEDYTLQLDSHHRFVKNWDKILKKMYQKLVQDGYPKPLITGYIPSYDPKNDPAGRVHEPWQMNFDRFAPEGYIFTRPSTLHGWQTLDGPVPSRFYSAHFAFTTGKFALEVQHDPKLYFHGEEPSIAARAFTHGYSLFHPHRVICWHEYTREGKTKQWDDDPDWVEKNNVSHYRYRLLHGMDGVECSPCALKQLKPYHFGEIRTLKDYERYAGLNFSERKVQQYTLDEFFPPNPIPVNEDEYNEQFHQIFKHCLDLYAPNFTEPDYDFWVVSFEELDGTVIYREDADADEVRRLIELSKTDGNWIRLWRTYQGKVPAKWVVWPHSVEKGWGDRIEQII